MRDTIRLALPSKGQLAERSFEFFEQIGMRVSRPNQRQYIATIPSMPQVEVILQRPGDIAIGIRQGSLDFGVTGYDILTEKNHGYEERYLLLHDALGFGRCTLNIAVPSESQIGSLADLRALTEEKAAEKPLRVATKFPNITRTFLDQHDIKPVRLINAEGTLEIAPRIGYADIIVDLVSSGLTLRDNQLLKLPDGEILQSQAVLVANRQALQTRSDALQFAAQLLEYIEAFMRGNESVMVVSNMRGDSAEAVAQCMFDHPELAGLRGPTIAKVYTRDASEQNWYSISIAVKKHELQRTISALREAGGSGVIVTPATYIFEEQPARYRAMLDALNK